MRELRRIWGKGAGEESRKGEEGLLASLPWLDFFCRGGLCSLLPVAIADFCCPSLSTVNPIVCKRRFLMRREPKKKIFFCSQSLSEIIVRITIYSLQFYKCPINLNNWYIQFCMCLSFIVYFAHNRFYTWKNCKIEK